MGRVVAPYGIKGWIKLQTFTESPQGLLQHAVWQMGQEGAWQPRVVELAKQHGAAVVAKLEGIADREQAAALQGQRVAIARDVFPAAGADEYYWSDLVGLVVINAAGVTLGQVSRVFETGANDVLVVSDQEADQVASKQVASKAANQRERLLPFIAPVIRKIDIAGGVITVDWEADY